MKDAFFRHAFGALVAALSRRFGVSEAAEDAAQAALMAAVETWPRQGEPSDAMGWLYRVALNKLLDDRRTATRRDGILRARDDAEELSWPRFDGEIDEELLRMLFVCCDPALPSDAQLCLALRLLCGFSAREIAGHLMASEASVYKRIVRAKARLRAERPDFQRSLDPARRASVRAVLYQMFNEGYLSLDPAHAMRIELCREAIRLCRLLVRHSQSGDEPSAALLALMLLHHARAPARMGTEGLFLLEEQDRTRWDRALIAEGLACLAQASEGRRFSRYHAEAGVALEHCLAPTLADTNWARIASCYALLEQAQPSPLHRLNRALAVAEVEGPESGLALLDDGHLASLKGTYLLHAVRADLYARSGEALQARRHAEEALASAPTEAIRSTLRRRFRSAGAF